MTYNNLCSPYYGKEIVGIRQYVGRSIEEIFDDIDNKRGACFLITFKDGTDVIGYRDEIEATFEELRDYYTKWLMNVSKDKQEAVEAIERCNAVENMFDIEETQCICYCCRHSGGCEMEDSHNTTEGTFCTRCGYYDPYEED